MWETIMQVERSTVVDSEPGRLWSLLSGPAVWSLWPGSAFVFAVPEAQALRFFIGPTRRGTGAALFEISAEVPGSTITLRTLPTGRQEYTLSVAAGRRGAAKASVQVKEIVPRQRLIDFEVKRRNDITSWLSAVRAVVEGRARWPGADMRAGLLRACMVRPRITSPQSTSASASISADPVTVWDAVHSPETARILGPSPAIYSGYVPGTPQGHAGEMQYFVSRRSDGLLTGEIAVVTETTEQRSALSHSLRSLLLETSYLLTPESESGPTRLDVTYRWQAPQRTDVADAMRSSLAESAQALVSDYKSVIETAGEPA